MLERRVNHFRIGIIEFAITFQQIKLGWLMNLRQELQSTKGEKYDERDFREMENSTLEV